MMNMDTNSSTHQDNNSTTRRQPVKVKWDYSGSYLSDVPEYLWPHENGEKVSAMEKTKQDASTLQLGTPRPKGTLVKCHPLIQIHTHIPISQVCTDETPTASHSVMTHAIIAFPPVVRDNTGQSGVHRDYTATEGLEESSLKRLMMTNNSRY